MLALVSASSSRLTLAVLHPRTVAVYQVKGVGDEPGKPTFFELNKVYEHKLGHEGLHFTAYNMCFGSFGGAYGEASCQ